MNSSLQKQLCGGRGFFYGICHDFLFRLVDRTETSTPVRVDLSAQQQIGPTHAFGRSAVVAHPSDETVFSEGIVLCAGIVDCKNAIHVDARCRKAASKQVGESVNTARNGDELIRLHITKRQYPGYFLRSVNENRAGIICIQPSSRFFLRKECVLRAKHIIGAIVMTYLNMSMPSLYFRY